MEVAAAIQYKEIFGHEVDEATSRRCRSALSLRLPGHRRHSSLGYLSPPEYESQHYDGHPITNWSCPALWTRSFWGAISFYERLSTARTDKSTRDYAKTRSSWRNETSQARGGALVAALAAIFLFPAAAARACTGRATFPSGGWRR